MYGTQKTTVMITPALMYTTVHLHAEDAWTSGMTVLLWACVALFY